jgi:F-type H+-transporting ATPase subunit gamma
MATAKEIRGKIGSIKSTQKITRAMELVAASKLKKSQQRMVLSKPYATKILQIIGHLARSSAEYKHPFLQKRDKIERVGYIVVSSDRGLCGGLNAVLFRKTLRHMKDLESQGIVVDVCPIGSKAVNLFKRVDNTVVAQASHLGDKPEVPDLIGVVKTLLDAFSDGKIDALYLCGNRFINTMKLDPYVQQLLPLEQDEDETLSHHWDYLYEPDAKELLDKLLRRYVESQVYQAVIENIACEQAARMVAMKSATDNAGSIIEDLQLVYNKARQAAITSEISEIVAGADAVSD